MPAPDPANPADPAPLRLLGAPELNAAGRAVPFAPERPYLLLAVLACRRDWVRRDELADLLYPGRELESARSNLRKVIFLARKVDGVGEIEQRGDLLRWAPDSDLQRFEAACQARRWGDAVATYGGPLLLGLESVWPAGGADWLDTERQRLQARWHEACTRRLAELSAEPDAARSLAATMLRHDPLDDTALEALGRAEQALGRRDAALAALADYSQRLSQEVGLAPSVALAALGAELRGALPGTAHAAPSPSAALVGRRHERSLVLDRLARPDCRVLTLMGPPGVGKSTLARALQAELGGTWVALESLVHADQVPERVAGGLGLALDGALPPWQALARALAPRRDLLLLDNAEHLALAAGLDALLAAAPQLRVLAASRAPLGVAGEWRLPLEGLPLPDRDETDAEVLAANDAVRLFVERARPLAPAFDLAAESADVVRLVHEVDGLPLAIELLAAWRRLMPVADILADLADSLDVLEPSTPSERSVRASFAKAWQQLGPVEQRVLSQLALLPAPIDRELVRGALQAPLPVLAALADRSLLHADGNGHFSLHPLIRRLAAPLATDADALHERHARHVARSLTGASHVGDERLPHLRAAWRWAVSQADAALLDALRDAYGGLLQRRALWREGIEAMDAHAQVLRAPHRGTAPWPAAQTGRALASVLNQRAGFCYQCGDLDDALRTAHEALALARQLDEGVLAAVALSRIGAVCWQRGDYPAARSAFMRQAELAAARPNAQLEQARAEAWIALVDKAEGDYAAALRRYEQAAQLLRAAGRLHAHLYLLNNLGNLLRLLGRLPEARQVLHEGLQLARAHGQLEDEPFLLTNIALVHEAAGDFDAAHPWAERAVASATEHGEPMIEAAARMARARTLAAACRQAPPALPDVWAALSIASNLQSPPARVEALIAGGVVLAHGGRRDAGLALLRWARAQPACSPAERADADRHLQRLGPEGEQPAAAALLPPDAPFDDALSLLQRAATP